MILKAEDRSALMLALHLRLDVLFLAGFIIRLRDSFGRLGSLVSLPLRPCLALALAV